MKLSGIAAALGGAGKAAGKTPVGVVLTGVGYVFGGLAAAAHLKRSRLEEGCKLEIEQQTQRPNGQGGSGGGSTAHIDDHGSYGCSTMYVPSPNPSFGNNDQIYVNGGKYVTMCVPIVFDLDGDGVEYRTLDAPVLMDPDGDGRFERSAWVSPDDGLLIYD